MIRIGAITKYFHNDEQTFLIKTNDCSIIDFAKVDIYEAVNQHADIISLITISKKNF